MTTRDLRPMALGEVLDRSFQVLRHHIGTLFVTAIVGTAPLLLLYLGVGLPYGTAMPADPPGAVGILMFAVILGFVLTAAVSWAALTREVDQTVTGGPVSFADGMRHGLRAFFRVLGLVIAAVKRAHTLGKGGRVRIVATAFVSWLLMMLPTIGLPFVLGMGFDIWTTDTVGTIPATQLYVYQAVSFLVGGLTTPFMVAVMVFTYYDRRVRREGYDVELVSESIPQSV
jgi:hypothetical protein